MRRQVQIHDANGSTSLRMHTVFMRIASVRRGEKAPFRSSRRLPFQAWRNEKLAPHENLIRLMTVIWTYHRKPPTLGSAILYRVEGGGEATYLICHRGRQSVRPYPVTMRRYQDGP